MNVLKELEEFIHEFNLNNSEEFKIDSIRVEFNKEYKLSKLKELGNWKKLQKNSNILHKLKKRLINEEVTSVMKLENQNIYYYNSNKDKPKYRKATMVIFGISQYHKQPPPKNLINDIVSILKNISNIDLCIDLDYRPNIESLSNYFNLKQYIEPKSKKPTDTYYINETNILMIDKITIYNKALKNGLTGTLWRIEALIKIPNIKVLALPLHEFKKIINIAKVKND